MKLGPAGRAATDAVSPVPEGDRGDERAGFEEPIVGAGVEPGYPAAYDLHVKLTGAEYALLTEVSVSTPRAEALMPAHRSSGKLPCHVL